MVRPDGGRCKSGVAWRAVALSGKSGRCLEAASVAESRCTMEDDLRYPPHTLASRSSHRRQGIGRGEGERQGEGKRG